jgi:hypothetical protein
MPTIYVRPRKRGFPFHYRVAERMAMRKMSFYFMMFGLFDFVQQNSRNAGRIMRRHANVIIPLMSTLAAAMLHEEIWLVRSTFYQSPTNMPMLRFQSGFWNGLGVNAENIFTLRNGSNGLVP